MRASARKGLHLSLQGVRLVDRSSLASAQGATSLVSSTSSFTEPALSFGMEAPLFRSCLWNTHTQDTLSTPMVLLRRKISNSFEVLLIMCSAIGPPGSMSAFP